METYFTFENLYEAYLDCRKDKTKTKYHLFFFEGLEENLLKLEKELQSRTYKPGRSIAFVVQKPKIREVFAADFRDRVVHHLLYNYLSPIFERFFIYDSWACRKNKGTHGAMLHLREFARKLSRERETRVPRCDYYSLSGAERNRRVFDSRVRLLRQYTSRPCSKHKIRPYYLKMDIKSFFMSIDRQILYNLIAKKIKNEEILWLTKVIIFHDCVRDIPPKIQSPPNLFDKLPPDKSLFRVQKGKGLPIGNLTSQFFANIYLNELDLFVKHNLKDNIVRANARTMVISSRSTSNSILYLRYVDDFILLSDSMEELIYYRDQIRHFLASRLLLRVHPKKQIIRTISSGIDFVGYIIRPDYTLVRRRIIDNWRYKLQHSADEKLKQQINTSYLAHAKWANCHWLVNKHFYRIAPFSP